MPRVIRTPPQVFPAIMQMISSLKGMFRLMETYRLKGLNGLKEAGVAYGMHSPCVRQVVNHRANQNRVISQDWKDLLAAILEANPQLAYLVERGSSSCGTGQSD